MTRSVIPIGFKLAGDDPSPPPSRTQSTVVIRIDVRWDRSRSRRETQPDTRLFGDRIII